MQTIIIKMNAAYTFWTNGKKRNKEEWGQWFGIDDTRVV